jgi:hypothetical protein
MSAEHAALAKGLEQLLSPLLANSEAQVESVLGSQQNLSAAIDRLVGGALGCAFCSSAPLKCPPPELDRLSASSPDGTAAVHAAKLAALRRRVAALSSALHIIQERLGRLHAAVARLPTATLADLAKQELHPPAPPSAEDLRLRAGPLGQDSSAAAAV